MMLVLAAIGMTHRARLTLFAGLKVRAPVALSLLLFFWLLCVLSLLCECVVCYFVVVVFVFGCAKL